MTKVLPFKKATSLDLLIPQVQPANDGDDDKDCYGPPPTAIVWSCVPCRDHPGVDPTGKFCFYVTSAGVHCWTCHEIQYFHY